MKPIRIWDTTLRDGEQSPGFALNKKQKIEVARLLEDIGVDTIEAGFPTNYSHDFESVKAVANEIKRAEVAAFSRAVEKDIEITAKALEGAEKPVIFTFTPGSDRKLSNLGWTREEGIERAVNAVSYAKKFLDEVEFGAEFSTRADRNYLSLLFNEAINAGATRLAIGDTSGYALPQQFGDLIEFVLNNVHGDYRLSIHCHNDLGLAVANSLAGVEKGATEVQVTSCGIGERCGNTSLETFLHAIYLHKEHFGISTSINYKAIVENVRRIAKIFEIDISPNSPVIGENAFATAAGIHIKGGNIYLEVDPVEVYGVEPKFYSGPHSGSYVNGDKKINPLDKEFEVHMEGNI